MWWVAASWACSCVGGTQTTADRLADSPYLFQGRVASTSQGEATLEVRHVWRGDVPHEVTIQTGSKTAQSSCDERVFVGEEVLVADFTDAPAYWSCDPVWLATTGQTDSRLGPPVHTYILEPGAGEAFVTALKGCDLAGVQTGIAQHIRTVDTALAAHCPVPLFGAFLNARRGLPLPDLTPMLIQAPPETLAAVVEQNPELGPRVMKASLEAGRVEQAKALASQVPARIGMLMGEVEVVPGLSQVFIEGISEGDAARPSLLQQLMTAVLASPALTTEERSAEYAVALEAGAPPLLVFATRQGIDTSLLLESWKALTPAQKTTLGPRILRECAATGRLDVFDGVLPDAPPARGLTDRACGAGLAALQHIQKATGQAPGPDCLANAARRGRGEVITAFPLTEGRDTAWTLAWTQGQSTSIAALLSVAPRTLTTTDWQAALQSGDLKTIAMAIALGADPAKPVDGRPAQAWLPSHSQAMWSQLVGQAPR